MLFFEGDFFFSFLFIIYVWLIARVSADDLDELNADPADTHWDIGKLQNNRLNVRGMLTSRILWTGIIMVAVSRSHPHQYVAVLGPDASQGPVINIVVYFFLALVLFSQIQFALLRGRWFWHQTPMAPTLTSPMDPIQLAFLRGSGGHFISAANELFDGTAGNLKFRLELADLCAHLPGATASFYRFCGCFRSLDAPGSPMPSQLEPETQPVVPPAPPHLSPSDPLVGTSPIHFVLGAIPGCRYLFARPIRAPKSTDAGN